MMSSSTLSPSGGGRGRPGAGTIVLVVILAIVLFAAGFAISRLITGRNDSSTPAALPCVTTTAQPGLTLPKPGTVTVNVYNATQTSGLAKRTATTLTADGFVTAKVANDPLSKSVTGVAEIRYGSKGAANAELMSYYLPGAILLKDTRTDATIDVVLGDGFKAVATSAAVQAQLAKPVVTTKGAGCPSSSGASVPGASSTTPPTSPAG